MERREKIRNEDILRGISYKNKFVGIEMIDDIDDRKRESQRNGQYGESSTAEFCVKTK